MRDDQLIERAIDEAPIGVTIGDASREDVPLIYINDAFERLTGYPKEEALGTNCRFLQGEGTDPEPVRAMREAIDREEPVSVELRNYRKDGTEFWNQVDIAPIHDGDEEEVTHFVGFQTDITARKRAEEEVKRRVREVERERRTLERVLERIEGLLEDVTRVLVGATTREGIEREVVERLTAEDAYEAAWIGERDPGTDAIVPGTWAGDVDAEGMRPSMEHTEDPVVDALATGHARFGPVGDSSWHGSVGRDGTGTAAAIPLISGGTTYGVLVVYADRPGAFDEHERVVLESIGRAIANAYNTLESRRILTADGVTELEFDLRTGDLFAVSLSARADCRFAYEGSAHDTDPLLFFTVEGANPERVAELATESPAVAEATVLAASDEKGLIEFRLAETSLVSRLANRGVRIGSIRAENGSGRLRVLVPGGVNSRSIVEQIIDVCPGASLAASREHDRPPRTDEEYRLSVEKGLTDRQLLALRKAYVSGYFDPDRRITGAAVAESMGISRSTFHQHLRAAERKLLREFFERELPD